MEPSSPIAPTGAQPDDHDLVRAARLGSLGALEALVSRHERRVFGLARRMTGSDHDAEDITQQTFVSAARGLSSFRGRSSFSTWVTAIAANAALKLLRKRRGLPTTSLDAAIAPDRDGAIAHPEFIADWREGPDRLAERAETREVLDSAIAALDPAYRAVFLLRDVEGLPVRETARALRITQANVKVRLLRARLKLRERLTKAFGDPSRRYQPARHAHDLRQPAPRRGRRS